jgi:hypothetical protein
MTDGEFWEAERQLWLGGVETFRRWMPTHSLMAFPEPVGVLTGTAVIENISPGPRWETIGFAEPELRRTGTIATVLAYRAEATRPGGLPYRAICTSTYVQDAGTWWLIQHQQTPV